MPSTQGRDAGMLVPAERAVPYFATKGIEVQASSPTPTPTSPLSITLGVHSECSVDLYFYPQLGDCTVPNICPPNPFSVFLPTVFTKIANQRQTHIPAACGGLKNNGGRQDLVARMGAWG